MKNKTLLTILLYTFFVTYSFCSYLDLGLKYFICGNYKLAEYMFKQSYINDESSYSLLYLANTYYVNKKYTEAAKVYTDFLNNYNLDNELRNFSEFMLAETLMFISEHEKALEILNKIDFETCNDMLIPYIYYNKIVCYFKLGEHNSAINNIILFETYVKNKNLERTYEKFLSQVNFIMAESWYAKGNYKKAAEHYQNFINRYTKDELVVYAKLRLANIFEEQKRYEQAIEILNTVELKKDYIQPEIEFIINYNTARLLTKQKKYSQAVKLYQQLMEKLTDTRAVASVGLELAYCYFQLSKYDSSLKILTNLPENLDNDLKQNVMFLTGLTLYNLKNYSEAIKVFTEFRKKFPTTAKWSDDVSYWLGLAYYNQQQMKQAMNIFSSIKKSSIYYVAANIYLARVYKELKEYDLAKLVLNKLLQQKNIDDNLMSILKYELAECYKLSGDFSIATQYYNQIIDSKNVQPAIKTIAKLALAEIYLLTGEYDNAERVSEELQSTTSPIELSLKCKTVYVLSKYYKGEFEVVEKLIQDILKSGNLTEDGMETMLTLLYNVYIKTHNVTKAIETMEKLLALETDNEKKFLLQLKVLKLAFSENLLDIVNNKITELQKMYKKQQNLCILNFYQTKYYFHTGNENLLVSSLDRFKTVPVDAFRFFTKNEFIELIKICSQYKTELIDYITTQIVPYVPTEVLSYEDKKLVMVTAIEEMRKKNMYTEIIKLLSVLKKYYPDRETSAYVEFETAQICELTGKLNLAEKIYKEIVTSYPKSSYAARSYVALAKYYNSQNNYEKVAEYEKKLLDEFPDSEFTHKYFYQKTIDLVQEEKYEEAIKNVTYILNSQDKNVASAAQKILADCYYKLGRYKEAAVEYLRVLYLYPDNIELCAEAQYRIGECAEKLKLYDEAKKAYTNSKMKYPSTLWAQEAELKLKQLR